MVYTIYIYGIPTGYILGWTLRTLVAMQTAFGRHEMYLKHKGLVDRWTRYNSETITVLPIHYIQNVSSPQLAGLRKLTSAERPTVQVNRKPVNFTSKILIIACEASPRHLSARAGKNDKQYIYNLTSGYPGHSLKLDSPQHAERVIPSTLIHWIYRETLGHSRAMAADTFISVIQHLEHPKYQIRIPEQQQIHQNELPYEPPIAAPPIEQSCTRPAIRNETTV